MGKNHGNGMENGKNHGMGGDGDDLFSRVTLTALCGAHPTYKKLLLQ